ncbi:DUF1887 family protein [Desulforhopalus vacuolatus]|uniref:Card1-like endonuclease domain-containing protein n=1 Tax=Desulforhopalus vacuolatus TaxID=40414 RepID=UPI0019649EBE|nr:DUF1887 family CARF protein [Desulforhopalus vacuolatus]MBM9520564.1 DUF1887 family protein [Desulforhopalus vacuolatus]
MKAHICLVSEQLLPNVLPVIHEKVDHVILLTTSQMVKKCELLKSFFTERGKKVSVYNTEAYDFKATLDVCTQVLEKFTDAELTLNVTGGTKIVALAAWQQCWFAASTIRIIYVDTNSNRLLELGGEPASHPLPDNILSVKEHLLCCGKKMLSGDAPRGEKSHRKVTAELCSLLVGKPALLRKLNGLVSEYDDALKRRRAPPYCAVEAEQLGEGGEKLCALLLKGGVATPGMNGAANLNDEASRFYAKGGWLEEYVYGVVADEKIPGLDLRMNVEIEWQGKGNKPTKNELDVVFTWHNRLHVISCKTSALDQQGRGAPRGKGPLYELDSLSEKVGGLYARSMLVSVHGLNEASLERARNLRIEVIAGRQVLCLSSHLEKKWLKREPQR